MSKLDSIFKSWDITLPTKVRLVKAMVFHVVMYGCESWTVKKAEHRRIDAFELWCWKRLLRVPWTARRSNQSILKEISSGCSLEVMMLKLKLQYFGHLMGSVVSLEKTLMLGGIGGRRRRGQQRIDGWMESLTRWMCVWVNSGSWRWTRRPGVLRFMGLQRVGHDLSDWTELNSYPAPFWASLPLCFTFLPSYCVVLMDSHTHFCSAVFCQALFPHTSHQLLFLFSIYNFSFFLLLKPFFPPQIPSILLF